VIHSEEPPPPELQITQEFTDENEIWRVHTSVDEQIIGSQKMLKLVSFYPETQADPTLHVAASVASGIVAIAEMALTGQVSAWSVLQAVQCCKVSSLLVNYLHGLPSFNRPV
jgi:hypothetical protein